MKPNLHLIRYLKQLKLAGNQYTVSVYYWLTTAPDACKAMTRNVLLLSIFAILGYGFWISPDFKTIAAGVPIFLLGMLSLEKATSLMNDSGFAYEIQNNLIDAADILFANIFSTENFKEQ